MRTALTLAALALALALALPAAASELELVPSPALRCLTPDAKGSAQPEYPFLAWKDGLPGRVRVELIFTTRDLEPEVRVLSSEGGSSFADAVKAHVRGFRELPLTQFLGSVRGIRQQRVSFDFNDMACPFELRLNYRQPLASNRVTEIGEPMASRRGFIAWLTAAELELAERAQSSVFGDNVLLQVPCARLELPSPAQPPFPSPQGVIS